MNKSQLLIRRCSEVDNNYKFNVEKARYIYSGGPYGYVVYLGEVDNKIFAYDLDGGKFVIQSKLGSKSHKSEYEDYESLWMKVGNLSTESWRPYLHDMQIEMQGMMDLFDDEKN